MTIASGFGIFLWAFQIFYEGLTWYDNACGTQVRFRTRVELTKTQERFREHLEDREQIRNRMNAE